MAANSSMAWPWHKFWWGYTNMGTIQIPPPPKYQIFTDRVTGILYILTFDIVQHPASDGLGLIGVNLTPVPPWPSGGNPGDPNLEFAGKPEFAQGKWPYGPYYGNVQIFLPYQEPYIRIPIGVTPYNVGNLVRLVISNDTLGMELIPQTASMPTDANNGRIVALQTAYPGYGISMREIVQTSANPGVGWKDFTITQTPNPAPYIPQNDFPSQQIDD